MAASAPGSRRPWIRLASFLLIATAGRVYGQGALTPGVNVNIVRGTSPIGGDPFLQRQNEPSIAVSTRNPCHLLAGANDYRTVDIPDPTPLPNEERRPQTTTTAAQPLVPDAWLGVYQSVDCGATWRSTLIPGYPQDQSQEGIASPNHGFGAAADPVVRAGTNGLFFFAGLAFNRTANQLEGGPSQIFVARYIDNNNKERGDTIAYVDTTVIASGGLGHFVDKPWLAVDRPRGGEDDDRHGWDEDDGGICEIAGQRFRAGQIYIAWSDFGAIGARLMFARSSDCGRTWARRVLADDGVTNQGASIAIAPHDGTVYVVWRRFQNAILPNSIEMAVSTNHGRTFRRATVASPFNPYDQPKKVNEQFRTNSLPTVTADDAGRVYVAWSERGFAAASGRTDPSTGDTRIVLAVSTDRGRTFRPRFAVDDTKMDADGFARLGHQIMPSLAFTARRLQLVYYDFSDDFSDTFEEFVNENDPPVQNGVQKRHTVDIRTANAVPAARPLFIPVNVTPSGTTPRLSQYRTIVNPDGTTRQVQFNPPNLPLYVTGSTPFIGDYIDVGGLAFTPRGRGWRDNNEASDRSALPPQPIYHAVWTDHRDVRPPPDGDWTFYKAPGDPYWLLPGNACVPSRAGMRNANIYTSRLTAGLYAGSPGNTKPLGFRIDPATGKPLVDPATRQRVHLQRGFVVFVQNSLTVAKKYLIKIVNQPGNRPGDRASLVRTPQPPFSREDLRQAPFVWLVAEVSPLSTISRTVFVTSADVNAQVRVDVLEVPFTTPVDIGQRLADAPAPVPSGLSMTVLLNPDPTNPTIEDPDFVSTDVPVLAEEIHDPVIFDPIVTAIPNVTRTVIEIRNPDESNPDESNPDESNQDEEAPDESNPDESNPDESNPDESNPDESNPDESNIGLLNLALGDQPLATASIVDVQWKVQSRGNTTTAFRFRPSYSGARDNKSFQLLVTKRYFLPDVDAETCKLGVRRTNQVLVNISDFKPRNPDESNPDESNPDESNPDESNPDESNPDESNATFFLAPGETATVTLRIYDTTTKVPPPAPALRALEEQVAAEVVSFASNTGEDEPPSDAAGPDLVALNPIVSPANVGAGGTATVTWTVANRGTEATAGAGFRTHILLSSDTVPSPDDRVLAISAFSGEIQPDDPHTDALEGQTVQSAAFVIPADATPGTNFIVIAVDFENAIFEADETNNHAPGQFGGTFALAFAAQPAATTQGFTIAPPVQVAVLSSAGAPVSAAEVPSVTLALAAHAGDGALLGTLTRPNVGGSATFSDLIVTAPGVGYTLLATAVGPGGTFVAPAASTPFTVDVDDPPVAVADSYSTTGPLVISDAALGVQANDIDELRANGPGMPLSGRVLRSILADPPDFGALTLNPNGTFTYTPAQTDVVDVFTYRLNDGVRDGNVTTVRISVGGGAGNTPPITRPLSIVVAEDSVATVIDVAAHALDADGDALVVSGASAANGEAIVAGGTIKYTPDPNYFGPDTIEYTIADGKSGPIGGLVSVTVTNVNDNPVAVDDRFEIAPNSGPTTFDVLANDHDGPDSGETLTITRIATPGHGTATFTATAITYTPNQGFSGPDSFSYQITDGHGGSAAAYVRGSVGTFTNTSPVAGDDAATTDEDTAVVLNVIVNDKDADGDAPTVTGVTPPAHGSAAFDPASPRSIRYTPNANFNGSDTFTYSITDGRGGSDSADVRLTVTAVNDAPFVSVLLPDRSVAQGAPDTMVNLRSHFDDFDVTTNADVLTFTVRSNSNSAVVTATITGATLALHYGATGTSTVTIRAADSAGALVDDEFVVTVGEATPTLSVADASITEGDSGLRTLVFTVVQSRMSPQRTSFNYITVNGTATAPDDFVEGAGQEFIEPGETIKTIGVAIKGDTIAEPDEVFTFVLSNAVNATIADDTAVGTILNDDATDGPRITATSLRDAVAPHFYGASIPFQGGTGPFTWRVEGGALPKGLTLDASGSVVGEPSEIGDFSFTARVTDAQDRFDVETLSLHVATVDYHAWADAQFGRAAVDSTHRIAELTRATGVGTLYGVAADSICAAGATITMEIQGIDPDTGMPNGTPLIADDTGVALSVTFEPQPFDHVIPLPGRRVLPIGTRLAIVLSSSGSCTVGLTPFQIGTAVTDTGLGWSPISSDGQALQLAVSSIIDPAPGMTYFGWLGIHSKATRLFCPPGDSSCTYPEQVLFTGFEPGGHLYDVGTRGVRRRPDTNPFGARRTNHTATRLADGRVLVAGGLDTFDGHDVTLASAFIYDPATDAVTEVGPLNVARFAHAAVLLRNGKVLITGGINQTADSGGRPGVVQVELFDPAGRTFTVIGSRPDSRWDHTATLLECPAAQPECSWGGKVLVAGGGTDTPPFESTVELYDAEANTWQPIVAAANRTRAAHTAVQMADGRVLLAGGVAIGFGGGILRSSEIYDPSEGPQGTVTPGPDMSIGRARHTAALLADGSVLIVGGQVSDDIHDTTSSLERYVPSANVFAGGGSLNVIRGSHSAVPLGDGRIAIAGGGGGELPGRSLEVFDPGVTATVVTIVATDPDASESGPDSGTFTITRTGSTTSDLTVTYEIAGSAENGGDYERVATSTIVPQGASSATVTIAPVDDPIVESPETVTLTLQPKSDYDIGPAFAATVTISDNDRVSDDRRITCGETLTGTIAVPGEQDTYTFSGRVGEGVAIAVVGASALGAIAELHAPNGQRLALSGFANSRFTFAPLPATGDYTIVVFDDNRTDVGSYNLNLQFTVGGACGASPIFCGVERAGTIDAAAEQDHFRFNALAGEGVAIAVVGNGDLGAVAELYAPNGQRVVLSPFANSRFTSPPLPLDGEYVILVFDDTRTDTGSYFINLQFTAGGATCAASPIACGETRAGVIAAVAEQDHFRFIGRTGDRARISAVGREGLGAIAELYAPNTQRVALSSVANGSFTTPPLPRDGEYTILVFDDTRRDTGPYDVSYTVVDGCPATTRTLTVSPATGRQGDSLDVSVFGDSTHFEQGVTTADFGPGITVDAVNVTSETTAVVRITIDAVASLGSRTVTLTTRTEIASQVGGFSVVPAGPAIVNVNPDTGAAGQSLTVVITGSFTHFTQDVTVADFGSDIETGTVTVHGPTLVSVPISISLGATLGTRGIALRTGDEVVPALFTVRAGTPAIEIIDPNTGQPGQIVTVGVIGRFTEWQNGVTVASFGPDISVGGANEGEFGPVTVTGPNSFLANLEINASAPLGPRDLVVRTGEQMLVVPGGFTLTADDVTAPAILRTSPEFNVADVPLNTAITLEFNEPLNRATVTAESILLFDHVTFQTVPGSASLDATGRIVTFVPSRVLTVGRGHSVVTQGLTDAAGNPYPQFTVTAFTTGFAVDAVAPLVSQTSPADTATDVPLNARVEIEFSEPMKLTTRPAGISVSAAGGTVPGTFTILPGSRTVTFNPSQPLSPATPYALTYTAALTDPSGNALANPGTTTFVTGTEADLTSAFVTTIAPSNGATNVGRNATVRVVFSEPVSPVHIDRDTFRIVDGNTGQLIGATVHVAPDRRSATLVPDAPLLPNTLYFVSLSSFVWTDLAGNFGFGAFTSFSTGDQEDREAPEVAEVSPPDGAASVPVNALLRVRLTELVDQTSMTAHSFVLDPPTSGSLVLEFGGTAVRFVPSAPLAPDTSYTIRVSGLRDQAGNTVAPFTSTFRTASTDAPDFTGPFVIAFTPVSGATDVPVTTAITLTFSERIVGLFDSTSVAVAVNADGQGFASVSATYTLDESGTVLTVVPIAPLPGAATVQVASTGNFGITDLAGNGAFFGFAQFTTANTTDVTPPTVIGVTPFDGASDVGPQTQVVLTFSEPLNPATVNPGTFALFNGAMLMPTSVQRSADNRTVMLFATLPFGATISVVATTGVRDLQGNAFDGFASRFTIRAGPDAERPGAPAIVTQRPGNGATGVPATTSITLFASERLNVATIPGALHVSQNGVLIQGSTEITGAGQAIQFRPTVPLTPGAFIQVFLDSSARDVAGNALFGYVGQFTVEHTAATPPFVTGGSVAGAPVPLNAVLDVGFNEPLDPATVVAANVTLHEWFTGIPVPATVSLRAGRVIRVIPDLSLQPQTAYGVSTNGELRDLQGNAVSNSFLMFFVTASHADVSDPAVTAVTPPAGATNVGINALLRIAFNEPINPLTASRTTVRVVSGDHTLTPSSISFDPSNEHVTLTPLEPLPDDATISVVIDGVEDLAGHPVTPVTTTFSTRTGADFDAPQIRRSSVFNGQTDVPINSVFTVEFDEPIDPQLALTTGNFVLFDGLTGPVAVTRELSADGHTVTLTPLSPLAVGRSHALSFGGLQDLAGNTGFFGITVSFTTAFAADATPPEIVQTNPEDGSTGVPRNVQLQVRFNEPVQATSLAGIRLTTAGAPVNVTAALTDGNRTITLTPRELLGRNSQHVLSVEGVADASGNVFVGTASVSFITSPDFDSVNPFVTLILPANGTTNVGRNAAPRVVFSEPVNPAAITGDTFTLIDANTGRRLDANVVVSADLRGATLVHDTPLAPNTLYFAQLGSFNWTDLAGNFGFGASTSFTTGAGVDETGPEVASVTPADSTSDVPVNALMRVRLNEPLDSGSIGSTSIVLEPAVAGTVIREGDGTTLTFARSAPLAAATSYVLRVRGLRDQLGNAMAPFASTFVTSASATPDVERPFVVSVNPPNFAIDVPVTTSIEVTLSERIVGSVDVQSVPLFANIGGFGFVQVPASYTLDALGTVITITPTAPLPGATTIVLWVNASGTLTDRANNVLLFDQRQFTTAATTDVTPPTVVAVTPADGTTDVGPQATVVLTFSEPLHPSTISHETFALFNGTTRLFPGILRSADNRTVMLPVTLPLGAVITVAVTSGVRDLSGNALADFSSTFSTRTAPDAGTPGAPFIMAQRPGNGAIGVPMTSTITLYATEPLDPFSVPGALHVSQNGVVVPGSVKVIGGGRAIHFTPAAPFSPGALVEVFLDRNARDTGSDALFSYSGQFTTERDTTVTEPLLLRTSAGTVPLNAVIDLEFSEPLAPATVVDPVVTVGEWFTGARIRASISLRKGGRVIRVVPERLDVRPDTVYFIAIQGGEQVNALRDLQGTPLAFSHTLAFVTTAVEDGRSPTVSAIAPPGGALNVGANALVRVTFDDAVNPLTVDGATIRLVAGTRTFTPSSISFDPANRHVTITPLEPLPDNETISVTVDGVEDLAGHSVTPVTTTFRTGATADFDAPRALTVSLFQTQNVPVNSVFRIGFNEPLDSSSALNPVNVGLVDNSIGRVIDATIELSGDSRTITVAPTEPLGGGRSHTLFAQNVQDLAGNGVGHFQLGVSFVTAFEADTTPPQVLAVSPIDGLANVGRNALVHVRFDEAVQPIGLQVGLFADGGVVVPATADLADGNRVLTLTPHVLLAAGTQYSVRADEVRDVAGNLFAGGLLATFSVGPAVDLVGPSPAAFSPIDGATGVPVNTAIEVTFDEPIDATSTFTFSSVNVRVTNTGQVVPVSISVSPDSRTVILTPSSPLAPATRYTVTTGFEIKDLVGNAPRFGMSATFTTQ